MGPEPEESDPMQSLDATVDEGYFAGPSEYVKDAYAHRIKAVYLKVNSEKAKDVNRIINQHKEDLHGLYIKICKKYNQTPKSRVVEPRRGKSPQPRRTKSPNPAP